jgi:hypothetical protein
MTLRDLDDRLLPGAAVRLRAAVEALARQRASSARVLEGLRPEALDRRFEQVPVVARLRERPVIAGIAALALLVAGLGAAAVVQDDSGSRPVVPAEADAGERPQPGVLGPATGTPTASYERSAIQGLVTAVQRDPMTSRVALVSFAQYRTPQETAALLSGFTADRVFVRARAAGKEASAQPVDVRGPLLPALERAYADTARNRRSAERSYQGYVDTLDGSSKEDQAFRALYAAFARTSRLEAREFGRGCACVFSALVTATPAQLLTLRARPGVRAVEVADQGLTASLVQVQPLLPEVVGVVPRPGARGTS